MSHGGDYEYATSSGTNKAPVGIRRRRHRYRDVLQSGSEMESGGRSPSVDPFSRDSHGWRISAERELQQAASWLDQQQAADRFRAAGEQQANDENGDDDTNPILAGTPKAYINWLLRLLDVDRFRAAGKQEANDENGDDDTNPILSGTTKACINGLLRVLDPDHFRAAGKQEANDGNGDVDDNPIRSGTKMAYIERLNLMHLALFFYSTLHILRGPAYLKKQEKRREMKRAHAQAIRDVDRFRATGEQEANDGNGDGDDNPICLGTTMAYIEPLDPLRDGDRFRAVGGQEANDGNGDGDDNPIHSGTTMAYIEPLYPLHDADRFRAAGEQEANPWQEQLSTLTRDHNFSALEQIGGVKGLADVLNTNLETGIPGDDTDLLQRKNAYGSNTYPQIKRKSFWMFLWEAWQDQTLIILMVAAVASLVLGIKTQGIKQGWYDGASIAFAVIIVIVLRGYKQSLQFQKLNEDKRNIHLKVIRDGRRVEVSIYDIVVGDIVPINIGDQVPADGVIITSHSLAINESSMTEDNMIVYKSSNDPFLISGCKIANGNGTLLVTSVGINTKWGLLARISEDTGEETILQERLNGVATLIGIVGLTMAAAVLVVLLARFFSGHTKKADGTIQFKAGKTSISEVVNGVIRIFTVVVTIVVVAMPGGLLLAVSLILAYLKRKMMANKALDPRLSGVKDVVQLCQQAGVKVRMITGDNVQTARAIALECGILRSVEEAVEPNVIEGKVFRGYSDRQREEIAESILVMACSSLNDKLLFVEALKKKGQVVAVTSRSTSDTTALHLANIGLSMGIQSTQVAKESSNIIILDVKFASIVKVVGWGRSMYANIQEFIELQLTVIVVGLIINVVTGISSGDVPLNAVQLPWVNLIMDALGALVLITEPPTNHLMHRSPVGRREPLITNIMWRNLFIQVIYQVTVLLVLNFQGKNLLGLNHDDPDHANKVKNTLMCNAFVLCQIFKEFARKSDEKNIFKGVTRNPLFIGYAAVMLVLQVIIIEFLGKFTSAVRLSWKLWLVSIAIGFVSWPLAYIGKLIPMPEIPILEFLTRKSRQHGNSLGNLKRV